MIVSIEDVLGRFETYRVGKVPTSSLTLRPGRTPGLARSRRTAEEEARAALD